MYCHSFCSSISRTSNRSISAKRRRQHHCLIQPYPSTLTQVCTFYPLLSSQRFGSHPRSALPTDPVEFRIPSSTQSVRYSHYGRQLPRADVLSCLLQATSDVIRELNNGRDKWISKSELQKSSNSVHLILHPSNEMTWGMWGTTLRGLADFVERWEFRDLDFEITEFGLIGLTGSGMLVYL